MSYRERYLKYTRIRNKIPRLDAKLVYGPQGKIIKHRAYRFSRPKIYSFMGQYSYTTIR